MSKSYRLLAGAMLCVAAGAVAAQQYPSRPVRLILAVSAGGGQDTVARAMAPRLSRILGANIIVDNRPGGGGNIGVEIAKSASPDGYTLLMISSSNVIHPLIYRAPYDLQRDFSPVAQLVTQPYFLTVPYAFSAKSVGELIAYARANPGKLNFGSAGNGSMTHLAAELLKDQARIDALHIPYKGTGAVYPDLFAGRLQFAFNTIVSAQGHVRANRLRALAISSAKRGESAPEVPTIAESGLPGYEVTQWYAVLAPRGTPAAIVERAGNSLVTVIQDPEMSRHLAADGAEAAGGSARTLAAHLKAEHERWKRIVERTGLRQDP